MVLLFGHRVWRGESGRRYRCKITLTRHGIPPSGGGVYLFVRRRFVFFLRPLYVGKATSFRERLLGHEKWAKAVFDLGATERHFILVPDRREREVAEEDLIRSLRPRMNDMMMPLPGHERPVHAELDRKLWWKPAWLRWVLTAGHTRVQRPNIRAAVR
jgi:hypothetical protein